MASPPKTPAAFCCWLVWSSWACSDGLETRVGVVVFRECKYFKYQLCGKFRDLCSRVLARRGLVVKLSRL